MFLQFSSRQLRPFTPRGLLAYSMEIGAADAVRTHTHTYTFNSFPLSLAGSTREGMKRDAGGPAARRAEKPLSIPLPLFLPLSRLSPVKPATFLLIKNFTEPRLSPPV